MSCSELQELTPSNSKPPPRSQRRTMSLRVDGDELVTMGKRIATAGTKSPSGICSSCEAIHWKSTQPSNSSITCEAAPARVCSAMSSSRLRSFSVSTVLTSMLSSTTSLGWRVLSLLRISVNTTMAVDSSEPSRRTPSSGGPSVPRRSNSCAACSRRSAAPSALRPSGVSCTHWLLRENSARSIALSSSLMREDTAGWLKFRWSAAPWMLPSLAVQ